MLIFVDRQQHLKVPMRCLHVLISTPILNKFQNTVLPVVRQTIQHTEITSFHRADNDQIPCFNSYSLQQQHNATTAQFI